MGKSRARGTIVRRQRKVPNYTLSDRMISLVAEITEIATHLEMRESVIDPLLRKKNRLKTIHSSLAIEQNTLTLQQVTDIIDGKRVFGPPKEIEEVKCAKAAYAVLEMVDPYSVKDLLKVHGLMVGGLTAQAGRFRSVEVGVYSGKRLLHAGVPHKLVPVKMRELLSWVKGAGVHPLISSCVFHYGLEYIHPFTDGNGRMGRYWQTALLSSWRAQMAWVPVEEVVRDRQDAYYRAISETDRTGDARSFIEFMLVALRDALLAVKKSVGKGVVKSVVKILDLIAQYPDITRERLAKEVGLSVRGVEKNLAQLKSEGKIVRIGGRKGGHWEVVKGRQNGEPSYHIVPSKVVAEQVKSRHQKWLKTPGRKGQKHNDSTMRQFEDVAGKWEGKWGLLKPGTIKKSKKV